MATARSFDGIDVADQIRDGHIRRRELFNVALLRREISNGGTVSAFYNQFLATAANRRVRIVMDLASRDVGHVRIQERSERAKNTALGLSAQAQQNKVMPRENCVNDLRD